MKTFADIKWKQHRLGKGFIQGLLMLDSGIELSVVAGPTMYSLPKDAGDSPDDFNKFEVAIFDKDGNFIGGVGMGGVCGWQSRSDIDKLIQIHS
tara:strand:+ start:396 stop:677 length:282 start_codon:yes stop_codon:yes gene_type:complete